MQSDDHSPDEPVDESIPDKVRAHINALKHWNPFNRMVAADALGRGDGCAVSALIVALNDTHPAVRRSAAEALGRIGDSRAVPALITALKDSFLERERAAEALGQIGDACAVPALIAALKDTNDAVGSRAAKALEEIGDAHTLPLKVLSSSVLTPAQKLNTLETLRHVRYTSATATLHYPLPSIPAYCQDLLRRVGVDDGVKEGVEVVLAAIKSRSEANTLVRAAKRDGSADGMELVRAASSAPSTIPPDQHVRASEPPTENEEKSSVIRRWLRRR